MMTMTKQQMVEAIREHNRSAPEAFLIRFNEQALKDYLSRLTTLQGHRGRTTVWVRQGVAPASATLVR